MTGRNTFLLLHGQMIYSFVTARLDEILSCYCIPRYNALLSLHDEMKYSLVSAWPSKTLSRCCMIRLNTFWPFYDWKECCLTAHQLRRKNN